VVRVLVTGGAGFIGSHLVRALLDRGDEVTVLDNFDDAYDPALKTQNLEGLNIELVHGDVRDRAAVEESMRGVDGVVHLAAKAGVRESLENPAEYASVNVGGTVTLLEALRERDRVPMVFASSSSVYGERTDGPFAESDGLGFPSSPYAGSKRAAELMCHGAHLSWGQPITMLRFFTVYGPRQRPTMAISKFIRAVQAGECITLFGDGTSRRDYTYVDDAVSSVLAALDVPQDFSVLNVGGGRPVTLDQLVADIGEATGKVVLSERTDVQRGDVSLTWADPTRIAATLGWKPEFTLVEGLRRTVAAMT
jgi:UDP-glucuronate 4-epimerase